ncbi:MAG: isoprenoid biosynthesis glyoxalase ElbB [Verrucomicrobium sp.]|nr:isoprenoid biosynthesis glyoxalase ElbB [Verrucomicrobium sp.]
MKRIGVLLSGCGVYDGSEIHEAVLTLLAIDRAGAQAVCLAPNIEQTEVVNHLAGKPRKGESRNVLVESARIARGQIKDAALAAPDDFDALVLPGGFGAAKNLCDFAYAAESPLEVEPAVLKLIDESFTAKKPLGFICISPVIAAAVLGKHGVEVTIGTDEGTAAAIHKMGASHVKKTVAEIHKDPTYPVFSTPAYMLGERISEVAAGIEKLVAAVIEAVPAR